MPRSLMSDQFSEREVVGMSGRRIRNEGVDEVRVKCMGVCVNGEARSDGVYVWREKKEKGSRQQLKSEG